MKIKKFIKHQLQVQQIFTVESVILGFGIQNTAQGI